MKGQQSPETETLKDEIEKKIVKSQQTSLKMKSDHKERQQKKSRTCTTSYMNHDILYIS